MTGNPVDVRCFNESLIISADGLIRMVIAHDIDNIHRLTGRVTRQKAGTYWHNGPYSHKICKREEYAVSFHIAKIVNQSRKNVFSIVKLYYMKIQTTANLDFINILFFMSQCLFFIVNNETTLFQQGKLRGDVSRLFSISHSIKNDEVPPWYALLGGVAGTVDAKIQPFFAIHK